MDLWYLHREDVLCLKCKLNQYQSLCSLALNLCMLLLGCFFFFAEFQEETNGHQHQFVLRGSSSLWPSAPVTHLVKKTSTATKDADLSLV